MFDAKQVDSADCQGAKLNFTADRPPDDKWL